MLETLNIAIDTLVAIVLIGASVTILYLRPRRFAGRDGTVVVAGALLVTLGATINALEGFEPAASALGIGGQSAQGELPETVGFGLGLPLLFLGLVRFVWRYEKSGISRDKISDTISVSEARLLDAIESISDGFALFDAAERLVICSEPYRRTIPKTTALGLLQPGKTIEEILRGCVEHGLIPKHYGSADEYIETRLARFRNPDGPIEHETQDGRWVRLEEKKTSNGGTVAIRTDITELKQSQELLSDAIEAMPEGFALYDADERLIVCNEAYRKTFPRIDLLGLLTPGTQFEDILRKGIEHGFTPPAYDGSESYFKQRLERFRNPSGPYEYMTNIGKWVRFEDRKTSNGGTVTVRSDITERKRAEEALKENEALLRSIIDNSPSVISLKDLDGRIIFVNEAYAEARGVKAAEMLREPSYANSLPEHAEAMRRQDCEVIESRRLITRFRDTTLPDGKPYQRIVTTFPVFNFDGELTSLGTISTDVSELHRAQQALQRNEARFRDFAESSADWFWETDAELRFTYMSENVERIVDVPPEWHYGKTRQDLLGENYDHDLWDKHLAMLQARKPFRNFTYLRQGEGVEPKWLSTSGTPVFSEDGTFLGYRGTGTDVTALKQTENLLHNAIETMSEGFAIFDADERLVICNQHYKDTLPRIAALGVLTPGTKIADIVRTGIEHGFVPPAYKSAEEYLTERLERFRHPSGPHEYGASSGRWYRSEEKKAIDGGTVAIRTEITEQKRIELALRESEQTLREILERSPIGVAITSHEREENGIKGKRVFVNDALVSMFRGSSREEMLVADISDTWIDLEQLKTVTDAVTSGEKLNDYEVRRRRMDGTEWWVSLSARPIRFDNQDCVMIWHFDITERKRIELALRESEQALREILEKSPIGVAIVHHIVESGRIEAKRLFANEALVAMFKGGSRDGMIEADIADSWVDLEQLYAVNEAMRNGTDLTDFEARRRRADGTEWWVSMNTRPIRFDNQDCIMVWHFDITERKLAEEALRERETLLRDVIDNMPALVSLKDAQGRYLMVNKGFTSMTGIPREKAIGKTTQVLGMDEENTDTVMAQDREVLETGKVHFHEGITTTRIGRFHRSVTKFPVFDSIGGVSGIGTVSVDITERKTMEEQLHQAQKMEAVGQLTGGVAHDFNNLLGVIIGNLDFLEETAGSDADRRNLIETAQQAALQGAELTNRLLAFSRKQSLTPATVDLNALILDMTELLKRSLGETVTVRTTAASDLKLVKIDAGQLETALLNLAVNSRHAMPQGGELTIETRNVELDRHYVDMHREVVPGEYAMLAVSDTGTGMLPAVLDRAFEPFFTTKDVGQGSGLGLSMVFGFVKQSGGHVSIYSEVGSGTTVKLFFPVAEPGAVADAKGTANSNETASGSGETVLIVEDDAGLRDLAIRTISSLGYNTLAASDGKSALSILENGEKVDVLFTDVVLPGGMNGAALAAAASARCPGLCVLYTSGYTESAIVHNGTVDENIELLDKPYRREELAQRLRLVLSGA